MILTITITVAAATTTSTTSLSRNWFSYTQPTFSIICITNLCNWQEISQISYYRDLTINVFNFQSFLISCNMRILLRNYVVYILGNIIFHFIQFLLSKTTNNKQNSYIHMYIRKLNRWMLVRQRVYNAAQ